MRGRAVEAHRAGGHDDGADVDVRLDGSRGADAQERPHASCASSSMAIDADGPPIPVEVTRRGWSRGTRSRSGIALVASSRPRSKGGRASAWTPPGSPRQKRHGRAFDLSDRCSGDTRSAPACRPPLDWCPRRSRREVGVAAEAPPPCSQISSRGISTAPHCLEKRRQPLDVQQSNCRSRRRSTSAQRATLDASLTRWNIDSPKNAPLSETPYNPPASSPPAQVSTECARPRLCSAQ